MPTLRRWIETEYARLDAAGKSALADNFEAFNRAYFEGDYAVALAALPDLHNLAEALGEAEWRVVIDYYAANANAHWRGNLAAGLERATRAVVRAERLGLGQNIPALYAREALLMDWLETDGPGYAGEVEAALDAEPSNRLAPDLAGRFGLVRAHCLAARGDGQAALALALRSLPPLEWPEAYQHSLRAGALGWAGRHADALESYRLALRGLEALGHSIERDGARLGLAESHLALGHSDEALSVLEEARHAAERSINRAHGGLAKGLTGQALLEAGATREAAGWLEQALEAFDGLGWLRTEAEFALRRVKALHAAGEDGAACRAALEDASQRAQRLRSRDLHAEVAALAAGPGVG